MVILLMFSGPAVVDVEARMLLQRLQYQAECVTISKDDRYLLCNMGQVKFKISAPQQISFG